jgi:hypothetical protein
MEDSINLFLKVNNLRRLLGSDGEPFRERDDLLFGYDVMENLFEHDNSVREQILLKEKRGNGDRSGDPFKTRIEINSLP